MKTKGFTLVELLVVIAILAILATVSVVGYTSFIDSAKDSNAATELSTITRQIDAQAMTTGYKVNDTLTLYLDGDGYYTSVEDDGDHVAVTAADLSSIVAHLSAHVDFKEVGTWAVSTDSKGITFTSEATEGATATWTLIAE